MVTNVLFKVAILILITATHLAYAADIKVRVDSTPVVDQSFRLIFEADSDPDGQPDFSPLEQQLTLLGRSSSSRTQIINGRFSHTIEWIVTLLSDQPGQITLPPIKFGRDRSPPLTLTIEASPRGAQAGASGGAREIFLEVESSDNTPYLHTEVIYTVRLYIATETTNPSLSEPKVVEGDAVIIKLGEDRDYRTVHEGREYIVVERRYALFPQRSGALTLAPIQFEARRGRSTLLFEAFRSPQTLIARSTPLQLNIRPAPKGVDASTWLPSKGITIVEQWSTPPNQLKVGEAVTRTVAIRAEGALASTLPALGAKLAGPFKAYPDQPQLQEVQNGDSVTGVRQESVALVPLEGGEFLLPKVAIPWWNTEKGRPEVAQLSERVVKVLPGVAAQQPQQDRMHQGGQPPKGVPGNHNSPQAPSPTTALLERHWQWIALTMTLIWIVTLLLWWLSRRRLSTAPGNTKKDGQREVTIREAMKEVKMGCIDNNPYKTRQALLTWATIRYAEAAPRTLHHLAEQSTPPLARELRLLSKIIYGGHCEPWRGGPLWQALQQQGRKDTTADDKHPVLEPLYR